MPALQLPVPQHQPLPLWGPVTCSQSWIPWGLPGFLHPGPRAHMYRKPTCPAQRLCLFRSRSYNDGGCKALGEACKLPCLSHLHPFKLVLGPAKVKCPHLSQSSKSQAGGGQWPPTDPTQSWEGGHGPGQGLQHNTSHAWQSAGSFLGT